jgi:hypothetical protein
MEQNNPLGQAAEAVEMFLRGAYDWVMATLTGVPQGDKEGGGIAGILLMFVFLVLGVGVVYFFAVEFLRRNRRSIPLLSRSPLGYPKPADYLVETSGMLKPEEFHYEWPDLVIAGTRYNLGRAERDPKNKLKFYLDTGTVVEFLPKK